MTIDEVKTLIGPLFVIAKRFGIRQSGKVRAIDDYSISGASSAVTSTEKLDLLGNDEMFALLKRTRTKHSVERPCHEAHQMKRSSKKGWGVLGL